MENTTNSATFSITTKGGYNVLLTLREDSIVKAKAILALVEAVDATLSEKGIKAQVKSFGGGFPKKEKNFTGEVCPLCGMRLHHITYQKDGVTKDGVACEGSLYDYKTKTKSGCKFFGFGKTLKEYQEEQARKASVSSFNSQYGEA